MHRASVVLLFGFALAGPVSGALLAQAVPGMTKFVVIPWSEDSGSRVQSAYALSPDGDLLAHLYTEKLPPVILPNEPVPDGEIKESVEVLDVRSARTLFTFTFPEYRVKTDYWREWNTGTRLLHYCDYGKYLVVSYGYGQIYVLETRTYQPHTVIDLKKTKQPIAARYVVGKVDPGPEAAFVSCAANSNVLALTIAGVDSDGLYSTRTAIRLFNLDTGSEAEGTEEVGNKGETPCLGWGFRMVISPDGKRMAAAWSNCDLWFAGNSMVATRRVLSNEVHEGYIGRLKVRWGEDPQQEASKPSQLAIWNIETGATWLIDSYPETDELGVRDISADGRVVLSDTGKARWCDKCNHGDHMLVVRYSQITLWKRETGQAIAQSPRLPVVHHKCGLWAIFPCDNWDEAPELSLSENGNAVLAYWAGGGRPVEVFFAPSPSSRH